MISSKSIENHAVTKIETMANNTMKINPYINSNDNKISFDGELEIYDSEDINKTSYLGAIQIQVKGKQVAKRGEKVIHRNNVKINDLKAYEKEGGVYYFVVYLIVENGKVIDNQLYGRQLHQIYLNSLLEKDQNSTTIEMYEIEDENILYKNCLNYLKTKRQQSYINQLKIKDIEKEPIYISTPENIIFDGRGFPLNDFYSYRHINSSKVELTIPDGILKMEKLKTTKKRKIKKNNKVIFEGLIDFEITKEMTALIIDNIFELQMCETTKKSKYKMLPFKNLDIKSDTFYIINEISKGGIFWIDTVKLNVEPFKIDIYRIKKDLDKLNVKLVEYSNLIPKNINLKPDSFIKQMREIVGLYELLENKDFEGFKMNSNNFYKLNFCGKKLLFYKYNSELYNVYSMEFMNRFEIFTKDMVEKVPIIYIFTKSKIKDILNFDINLVKKFIETDNLNEPSDFKWEKVNNFSLELIDVYDYTKTIEYLDLAEYILHKLDNKDNDKRFINLINKAQIMKRKNIEVKEIISELIELHSKLISVDKELAYLNINVIAGSKQEAETRYQNLDKNNLKNFEDYPIFKLYQDLVN
ncbi:hypothetical protein ACQKGE_11665 [Staphylococcus hominis]|uniref:hypothetical protein n=1 Tax=Staphylococcus hominis TaxID=1290 RepID=UPI003CFF7075